MAEIIHRIGTRAAAAKVYQALTTVQGLSAWWTQETSGDALKGSTLRFRFRGGGPDMKVVALRKNQLVRWKCLSGPDEWIGTELEFKLKREGQETILLFAHKHWSKPTEFMAHCSTKWAYFLLSLKAYVETGKGKPYPKDQDISDWG